MSSDPDYLQKILTAAVYDVAIESPLDRAHILSERLKNLILLKREDMQPDIYLVDCTHSFTV